MSKRKQLTTEQRQKQVISRLKNENAKLRQKMVEKDEKIFELEEKLEKTLLYIEELQKYVFRGKKKKDDEDDKSDDENNSGDNNKSGGVKRSKKSYRRSVPNKSEITDERVYEIKHCPDCGSKLSRLKVLEFYEEDVIPIMEWYEKLKKITLIKITTGYCSHCGKRVSAIPIPKQRVFIGENIKQLIVFQSTVQQLSFSQIMDFADSHLNFQISAGEVAHILSQQAKKLKPALDDLLKSIKEGGGVHMDETSYNIAFHDEYSGNYAWAMTSMEEGNNDTVFVLGKNRGMGNAKDLIGEDYQGFGVTDDYPAYKNLFSKNKHVLCWAHPIRKFRDLKNSNSLSKESKKQCQIFYKQFFKIYEKVMEAKQTEYKKEERLKRKKELMAQFETILKPTKNGQKKLETIKKTLLKSKEEYFVCITEPNVPTTNNKAERALRHLVIKRKKSFGSKTPKGAEVMSILYSVVMSLWWRSKKNFFASFAVALA